jgi:hypothetical protein
MPRTGSYIFVELIARCRGRHDGGCSSWFNRGRRKKEARQRLRRRGEGARGKLHRDRSFPTKKTLHKSRGTWESNCQFSSKKLNFFLVKQKPDQNTSEGISTSSTPHPQRLPLRSQFTQNSFRLDKYSSTTLHYSTRPQTLPVAASVTLLRSNQIQFITIDVNHEMTSGREPKA